MCVCMCVCVCVCAWCVYVVCVCEKCVKNWLDIRTYVLGVYCILYMYSLINTCACKLLIQSIFLIVALSSSPSYCIYVLYLLTIPFTPSLSFSPPSLPPPLPSSLIHTPPSLKLCPLLLSPFLLPPPPTSSSLPHSHTLSKVLCTPLPFPLFPSLPLSLSPSLPPSTSSSLHYSHTTFFKLLLISFPPPPHHPSSLPHSHPTFSKAVSIHSDVLSLSDSIS